MGANLNEVYALLMLVFWRQEWDIHRRDKEDYSWLDAIYAAGVILSVVVWLRS